MARKKKKDDTGSVIPGIIFLVVCALAIVAPLIMTFGCFVAWLEADKIKNSLNNDLSDFWLDHNEKNEFKQHYNQLVNVENIITNANNKGIDAKISRNKDGAFSARSNLGKEIRATFDHYIPKQEHLKTIIIELQNRPLSRWVEFNTHLKRFYAFQYALLGWFMVLAYNYHSNISITLIGYLNIYLHPITSFSSKDEIVHNHLIIVVLAAFVALIAYFIGAFLMRNSADEYSPKPNLVSANNVDDY